MHFDGYQEFQKGTRPRCEFQETETGGGTERKPSQIPGSAHKKIKVLEALEQNRSHKKGRVGIVSYTPETIQIIFPRKVHVLKHVSTHINTITYEHNTVKKGKVFLFFIYGICTESRYQRVDRRALLFVCGICTVYSYKRVDRRGLLFVSEISGRRLVIAEHLVIFITTR